MGFTEIFVSTHDEALKRAAALDGGGLAAPDALRIPDISDFEIEQLGDLAGAAVHASGADYELAMVDVASDSLLGVPAAMVRALAELLSYETEGEGNVLEDVAARWAAEEDMPLAPKRPSGMSSGSRRWPAAWTRTRGPGCTSGRPERPAGCQVEIPPLIWHNKQVLDLRGPSLRVRILSF